MGLTAEQKRRGAELRAQGQNWHAIAKKLRLKYYAVRAELDPNWKGARIDRIRAHRKRETEIKVGSAGMAANAESRIERNPAYDPARDGPPVYDSPYAQLLGDPPIGRRALDARRGA